jgi:glycosyltransferase involved in cell wall biosynthesis
VQVMKERQPSDSQEMCEALGIRSDRKTIGIVARLVPVKKMETLVNAAVLLTDLAVQFLIVGDGQERRRLEAMVNEVGQSDRFIFTGHQKDPFPWISAMNVGVLCSESEGFPQAILEYMAVGIPVVASSVGGIPELMVDGETGFLVSPHEPTAFAGALHSLINNKDLSEQMGKAGQKRARDFFSLDQEILSYAKFYKTCLIDHR